MPPGPATHWKRQVGDGLVYDGPCVVKTLIFAPQSSTQRSRVYDGRDATSGTLFCTLCEELEITRAINLGDGVRFGRGVYIDADADDDELTVTFIPRDT